MTTRLILSGILFGLGFGGAMGVLILLTGGTPTQAFLIGVPLAIGGGIGWPLTMKQHLATRTEDGDAAVREAWRRLIPVVAVDVAAVVGTFVFDGWVAGACGVIAFVCIVIISRRLREVML